MFIWEPGCAALSAGIPLVLYISNNTFDLPVSSAVFNTFYNSNHCYIRCNENNKHMLAPFTRYKTAFIKKKLRPKDAKHLHQPTNKTILINTTTAVTLNVTVVVVVVVVVVTATTTAFTTQ